jgi:hypothetical protein
VRHTSLTGVWSGAYRYPGNASAETVFNADMEEVGGAFVGSTQEPNLFAASLATVLTAEIEGVREGAAVTFTKFYHDGGIKHAIRYEGTVDDGLTRIDGRWSTPGEWSGTFFMTREDDGAGAETKMSAEATIEKRR